MPLVASLRQTSIPSVRVSSIQTGTVWPRPSFPGKLSPRHHCNSPITANGSIPWPRALTLAD